jgi:hypothetical protein
MPFIETAVIHITLIEQRCHGTKERANAPNCACIRCRVPEERALLVAIPSQRNPDGVGPALDALMRSPALASMLRDSNFLAAIPLNKIEDFSDLFEILRLFIVDTKNEIPLEVITAAFLADPRRALILLSFAPQSISRETAEMIFTNADLVLNNEVGAFLISLLAFLQHQNESYSPLFRPVFTAFMRSTYTHTANAAFSAFIYLFTDPGGVDASFVSSLTRASLSFDRGFRWWNYIARDGDTDKHQCVACPDDGCGIEPAPCRAAP